VRALSGRSGMWIDLGLGTASFPCAPLLKPSGTLHAGEEVGLHLTFASPGKPGWLVMGTSTALVPFGNGWLVPSLDVVYGPFSTSPAGTLSVTGRWPDGIPSDIPFTFQAWVLEYPGVDEEQQPPVFQASNALTGVTP
jgi:hypothetical protein